MKRLFTLIALLGLVGLFTGCQGGSSDTTTSTNAPAATSTNAPAPK